MKSEKLIETVAKDAGISAEQSEVAVNTFFSHLAEMKEEQVESLFSKYIEEEGE